MKGGLIAGTACALGGMVAGPPGMAIGGALGGCAAAAFASSNMRPLSQVINSDMPVERKDELVDSVRSILTGVEVTDAMELIALVQGNTMLKARIAQEMVGFFTNQMNMNVQSQVPQ